jgi:hypothetical protein
VANASIAIPYTGAPRIGCEWLSYRSGASASRSLAHDCLARRREVTAPMDLTIPEGEAPLIDTSPFDAIVRSAQAAVAAMQAESHRPSA